MNESMNFGNLGFSSVTAEEVDDTPAFAKEEQEKKVEAPVEEVEDEKDPEVDLEEMKKKDAEAAKDFESAAKSNLKNYEEDAANFSNIDFGPMQKYLDDDDITDISYSNGGQLWLKSLSKGVYRADQQDVDNALMEKIAFQCSNIMGKTFNMAHPFLDSESAELRMNFVHDSIARNGIAVVFRKTPAKIRLEKQKLLNEKYVRLNIHEFLINCVLAHCNIIVCGETGSGKTELVKYLASHTRENEKLISIEDTLELHLDRIYPHRDIVAMKTNNIASYSDVLVTCMRQNPIWILLSEVRSAEAVTAVRNSISSGHYILSTIHADKAESIPHRMYSLLESNIDVEQFLKTIYRYVQIGVFVRGRYKPEEKRFVREIAGICEFHVTDDEKAEFTNIYLKNVQGEETFQQPSKYLLRFLEGQGCDLNNLFGENRSHVTDGMDMSKIKSPKVKIGDEEEEIKPPVNPNPNPNLTPDTEEVKAAAEEEKLEQEVEEVKEEITELKEEEQKIEEEITEMKEELVLEDKEEEESALDEDFVPNEDASNEQEEVKTEKVPAEPVAEEKAEEVPKQAVEEQTEAPVETAPEEPAPAVPLAPVPVEEPVVEEPQAEAPVVETEAAPEAPTLEPVIEETKTVPVEEAAPVVEEETVAEEAPEPTLEPTAPEAPAVETEAVQEEPAPAPAPELTVEMPVVEEAQAPTIEPVAEEKAEEVAAPETPAEPVLEPIPEIEMPTEMKVEIPGEAEEEEAPKEELVVSVQEEIPVETPQSFEITGSSPNDIIAKPVIDIATLESANSTPEPETKEEEVAPTEAPAEVPEPAPAVEEAKAEEAAPEAPAHEEPAPVAEPAPEAEPAPVPAAPVLVDPVEEAPRGPLTTDPGSPQIDINQSVGQAPSLIPTVPPQPFVDTSQSQFNNQFVNTQNQVPVGALGIVGQNMMQPNNMMVQPPTGFNNPGGFLTPPGQMNTQMNNMNLNMGGQISTMPNVLQPPGQGYMQPYQAQQMMPQNQFFV